jgi:transcriptional regulator with XRE-family HTH domain
MLVGMPHRQNKATDRVDADPDSSRLRRWRRREGYSLNELAGLTGLSISMLSLTERGERQLHPKTKVRLARALRVPVGELFDVEPVDDAEAVS